LEKENVEPEDAGSNLILVSNDLLGENSSDNTFEVDPLPSRPRLISPLTPVKVTEGFPVQLEAEVKRISLTDLVGLKDGKKVKEH